MTVVIYIIHKNDEHKVDVSTEGPSHGETVTGRACTPCQSDGTLERSRWHPPLSQCDIVKDEGDNTA